MKPPTEKQARLLRLLAGGYVAIAPYRSEWMPMVRREWVESATDEAIRERPKDSPRSYMQFLPPLTVTSAGLRALADALDAGTIEPVRMKPKAPS